ncbi:Sister chromatid cohesion protein Dcc1 [Cinnamomum micranthum f. kanehirae]|uniref:Sister chromatid cohesion protein Dcc1 n=1 Tax=Cinnamomum micranthum f. kanehirae TaxID=337451 RepID=A0A3S3QJI1_9MAGN|nr:Sister chromatid cohesion protein Dcc1 [Cinnamomum micranthum f. kanehirae]
MDGNGGAEAVLNLPCNSSISVAYDPLFGSHEDLLLLEVDPNLLPHFLNNRVTIRGQPNEEAVLCTPSTTFALKFISNSNSLFLIPPTTTDRTDPVKSASVLKIAPGNMELVQVAPKLDKLKTLLCQKPYRAEEEEDEDDEICGVADRTGFYTWDDLVDRIQASDEELRGGLQAISAVEIDGYWRVVDEELVTGVLSMLVHDSVLFGWSLEALNEEDVVSSLEADGFSTKLAFHCLGMFGSKVEGVWSLDERRVCVHFARQVLKKGKKKMENFMEEWERSIPSGMCARLEMLEGEVLVDRIGVESWIRPFSVSSLPSTPAERFAALFRERQKWEWRDLEPYIRDLRVPGLSSEGLLIKYTRRTQPTADVEPVFSAR